MGSESRIVRSQNSWNLQVFNSGTIRFSKTDGLVTDKEDFSCHVKKVFEVTSWTYGDDTWEKPVTSVKLTLSDCKEVEGAKKCDIKIADGIGLQFNPEFKPKAIFK